MDLAFGCSYRQLNIVGTGSSVVKGNVALWVLTERTTVSRLAIGARILRVGMIGIVTYVEYIPNYISTISYHIISYHIISYHIISYHIRVSYNISYHIIYHITSHHIISYISEDMSKLKQALLKVSNFLAFRQVTTDTPITTL